jgi:hypothetical protein
MGTAIKSKPLALFIRCDYFISDLLITTANDSNVAANDFLTYASALVGSLTASDGKVITGEGTPGVPIPRVTFPSILVVGPPKLTIEPLNAAGPPDLRVMLLAAFTDIILELIRTSLLIFDLSAFIETILEDTIKFGTDKLIDLIDLKEVKLLEKEVSLTDFDDIVPLDNKLILPFECKIDSDKEVKFNFFASERMVPSALVEIFVEDISIATPCLYGLKPNNPVLAIY